VTPLSLINHPSPYQTDYFKRAFVTFFWFIVQAYKKATESSPEQPVAWEGLIKCCEKYGERREFWGDHVRALKATLDLHKVPCIFLKVLTTVSWYLLDESRRKVSI
jgi:hypothetical protein